MAGENAREGEPEWVRRLREHGHHVEGGEGDFPEEPRVAFEPMQPAPGDFRAHSTVASRFRRR
jgi:hypothetical protein